MEELIASCRVPSEGLQKIRCEVRRPRQDPVTATVVAMTDVWVKLAFPPGGAPDLPLGFDVEVACAIGGRVLERQASVCGRADTETGRLYELRLLHSGSLRGEFGQLIIRHSNLRGAFRVRPDVESPISASVRAQGVSQGHRVEIEDISVTGLAGLVASTAETDLCPVTNVTLDLDLGEAGSATVEARIVGRELDGTGIRYRFAFRDDDPSFERELDAVVTYVMSRQQHLASSRVH